MANVMCKFLTEIKVSFSGRKYQLTPTFISVYQTVVFNAWEQWLTLMLADNTAGYIIKAGRI